MLQISTKNREVEQSGELQLSNFLFLLSSYKHSAMVSFFGLSAGSLTIIYASFFAGHSAIELHSFLRFLALTMSAVVVAGTLLSNEVPESHASV